VLTKHNHLNGSRLLAHGMGLTCQSGRRGGRCPPAATMRDARMQSATERFAKGYFLVRTLSLAALAIRNLTTVLAGILIASPVAGFRPMRAFRFCFTSFPSPGTVNSPDFLASR